jgi:hypothetical protein
MRGYQELGTIVATWISHGRVPPPFFALLRLSHRAGVAETQIGRYGLVKVAGSSLTSERQPRTLPSIMFA